MSPCHHCHHVLSADSQFCPECGTSVEDAPGGPPAGGPDNIAMMADGLPEATPPTLPEPAKAWQPQYSDAPSTTVFAPQGPGPSAPAASAPAQPPYGAAPSNGPAGQYPPQGPPSFDAGAVGQPGPPGAQPQFIAVSEQPSGGKSAGKLIGLGLGVVGRRDDTVQTIRQRVDSMIADATVRSTVASFGSSSDATDRLASVIDQLIARS